jgi:hypothetical protein
MCQSRSLCACASPEAPPASHLCLPLLHSLGGYQALVHLDPSLLDHLCGEAAGRGVEHLMQYRAILQYSTVRCR